MLAWRRRWAVVLVGGLMLFGAAVALGAPKAGSYTGVTAQGLAIAFGVASGGKAVTNFEPTFTANCTKAGAADLTTPHIVTDAGRSVTIVKKAFVSRNGKGTVRNGTTPIASAVDQVKGKFTSAHSAKGTYSVVLTFDSTAPDGFAGYTCSTGTVTWTATRK